MRNDFSISLQDPLKLVDPIAAKEEKK